MKIFIKSQKECQEAEQVNSTAGKLSRSTPLTKNCMKEWSAEPTIRKPINKATEGSDAHLEKHKQAKNKKLPVKTVKVKSWVEKLLKSTNLLHLQTPKNQK